MGTKEKQLRKIVKRWRERAGKLNARASTAEDELGDCADDLERWCDARKKKKKHRFRWVHGVCIQCHVRAIVVEADR